MTTRSPFKPHYGTNLVITPAAGSAETTLISGNDRTLRVVNTGAAIGYFRTAIKADAGTVVATTADVAVPSGATVLVEIDPRHDTIATISASGTTFQVMRGEGGA